jgi:hypothetical protein
MALYIQSVATNHRCIESMKNGKGRIGQMAAKKKAAKKKKKH